MTAAASSALWFLPFVLPICLWVAWSDLAYMRIPNWSVLALVAVFVVIGPIALPFDTYLWRIAGGVLVLAIGIGLYAIGGIGAGDIKFAAALAPFVDHGDLSRFAYLFFAATLAAFATHRLARALPALRRAAPNWKSWDSPRFPLGLSLTASLVFYLILVATTAA